MHQLLQFAAAESGEHAGGVAALGVDVKAILLQLATFLLVFLLLKKFAFGSILKSLEERREKIDASLSLADELSKRQDELEQQVEAALAKARKQAEEIIARSHEEAGAVVEAASERATKRAEDIMAEQQTRLEQEVTKVRTELKKEVLELVVEATETVLDQKLDGQRDHELVAQALKGRL